MGQLKKFDMSGIMLRNFPKQFPELSSAKDVSVKNTECPNCQELTMWVYSYEIDNQRFEKPSQPKCNSCGTKELQSLTTQHFVEKRINQLNDNWYIINEKQGQYGFKNFVYDNPVLDKAYKQVYKYLTDISQNNIMNERNLLLQGSTGAGKTHLATALARTLKHRGFKVGYVTAEELFSKFKRTFNQVDSDKLQERIFYEMASLDILVIDDIGTEANKIVEDTSWSGNTWTKIIEARFNKCNVWTTNHDEEQLYKVVGQRAFSRMHEETHFINMFTVDNRKEKAIKN